VSASSILSYFGQKAEIAVYASHDFNPLFGHLIIRPAISLMVASPYLVLWIALSLLAVEEMQEPEIGANSDDTALPSD
jgi:hypothetical protein